jgi:hypothetical protein
MYVRKAIQLSTTEEELKSVSNWVDPTEDLDLFTLYDDKARELKGKK